MGGEIKERKKRLNCKWNYNIAKLNKNTRKIHLLDGWVDWLDWQNISVLNKLRVEHPKEEFSSWIGQTEQQAE